MELGTHFSQLVLLGMVTLGSIAVIILLSVLLEGLFALERGGVLEGGFGSVGVSAGSSWPEYGTGSWPGCGSHVRCA